MKVIFAGTPDFSAQILRAITNAGFDIPLVLTQPDRPSGRGMKLRPSPVKQLAIDMGLNISQPTTLKTDEIQELLKKQNATIMVVAAYGLILPSSVLNIPSHGCLNIHTSLLPRWRGAAPIQRAIEAGDNETGVCIMQMDTGLDTGDIISQHTYKIKNTDTAIEVNDALANLGSLAIVENLHELQKNGFLNRIPQSKNGITYAEKLSKGEAKINWNESAEKIDRKIRAFNPIPTAWTVFEGNPLKIWKASIINLNQSNKPGEILEVNSEGIVIACGHQSLVLTEIQPSGSKRMKAIDFALGHHIHAGMTL